MEKLLSIIVPVYNAERTIEEGLGCILRQNTEQAEIICVDDGSQDGSREILERIQKSTKDMKIISQKNAGVSAARNTGILHAKGEYLLFVDSDDFLSDNALDGICSILQDRKTDLLIFASNYVKGHRKVRRVGPEHRNSGYVESINKDILSWMDKEYFSAVWNKVYKRQIIRQEKLIFNTNLSYGEDVCFNLKFLYGAKTYVECPEAFYNYQLESGGAVTKNYNKEKLKKLAVLHQEQFDILEENKALCRSKLMVRKRGMAVRYCYSSFIDLFCDDCKLNKKQKLEVIAEGRKKFGIKFTLTDNRSLGVKRAVLNTVMCIGSDGLIYYTAAFFSILKKISKYKGMY